MSTKSHLPGSMRFRARQLVVVFLLLLAPIVVIAYLNSARLKTVLPAEPASETLEAVADQGSPTVSEVAVVTPEVAAAAPQVQDSLEDVLNEDDLPTFDLIRIDASGSGLVAGRALPGSVVQILAGDDIIATAEASADGEFVAFIQTLSGDDAQILSLRTQGEDGPETGDETVLVLPVAVADDEVQQAPTVVTTSRDEVRVVQPSALGQVDGVTLDSISYDEEGQVRLAGRAPAEQPIRIYVDGEPIGEARATSSGAWDAMLDTLVEGQYTLRVDALRADGSVASRAESPFQRVFPTAEQRRSATRVTVQPGNSLWVLAEERYGEGSLYTQIFAANQDAIRDPDLIYPGQIFDLPEDGAEPE